MKKNLKIILSILWLLLPWHSYAYDFVENGVYYNITSRFKRTVEVTHWEEQTLEGKPRRVLHHHNCSHDHTHEHLSSRHQKLIALDEAAVQREKTAYVGSIIVPEKVRYKGIQYKVTGIGDGSFWGRKQLTEVLLPTGIQYIGESAFENCVNLRKVNIPSAVTRIGFAAFRRCMALQELNLPDSLRTIDLYAFAFCQNLVEMTIPEKVSSFPGNIFFQCLKLKTISLQHAVPPVIKNDVGLKMDFKKIIFFVPHEVFPLYQGNEFWRTLNVQAFH